MSEHVFDLKEQFSRICRLLHTLHHHREHGPWGDPHRGQGRVLALLKLHPEISQKELSYLLDIRQQSLGELLAKLEHKGYITRAISETDNRAFDIRLTEAGATAAAGQDKESPDLFMDLTGEEQHTLSGYLDRVITGLEGRSGNAVSCGSRGCQGEPGRRRHGHGRHGRAGTPGQDGDETPRHGRCRRHCGKGPHSHQSDNG